MNTDTHTKSIIEKQFHDLFDKAKLLYPDIDNDILSYTNTTASTERLQDYLNLTMQAPLEVSTNHIAFM
jgi:hypothetical protein